MSCVLDIKHYSTDKGQYLLCFISNYYNN